MTDTDGALAWEKMNGLLPAVVQDADSGEVLMVAYMNEEALAKTRQIGLVTFFSRSKQRLWTKGETSGNELVLVGTYADCDGDALLLTARPRGPVCHLGTQTCFADEALVPVAFLARLQRLIDQRNEQRPAKSYTTSLFEQGTRRIAQKIGEEGVEVALALTTTDTEEVLAESADLLFHLMVGLSDRQLSISDVLNTLAKRHAAG
nr:histidine biosynthesis bifunctional protein HisIE-like [Nerophis lumbriciformis]